MNNYPLIEKTYSFILFIIPILRKFPKDQRYLIAQEIEKKSLMLLENYQKAIYFPKNRAQILTENNFILETLRTLWRLAKDLGYVNFRKFGLVVEQIEVIGKMTGGWLKSEFNLKNSTEYF